MKNITYYTNRIASFFTSLAEKLRGLQKTQPSSQTFWRECFENNAKLFCGLYTPMLRLANGRSRKPERVLAEWSGRVENNLGELDGCEAALTEAAKALDTGDAEAMTEYARKVLSAAKDAGITHDKRDEELTVTEQIATAYTTEEGEQPYLDDRITVETPAWYQNGVVIETGSCTLC